MAPDAVTAEQLASRLLARFASLPEAHTPDGEVIVARLSCEQVYRDLSRWLGPRSARALLSRGLGAARLDHPAVAQLRVSENGQRVFNDTSAAVAAHGSAAVAAGLRAVLTAMIDLLSRLIGTDMTARLLDGSLAGGGVQDERAT